MKFQAMKQISSISTTSQKEKQLENKLTRLNYVFSGHNSVVTREMNC